MILNKYKRNPQRRYAPLSIQMGTKAKHDLELTAVQ